MLTRLRKEDFRLEDINEINTQSEIYIYGVAATARTVMNFLLDKGNITVCGFVVDDEYYKSDVFCGKKVYKYSEWIQIDLKNTVVVYGFTSFNRKVEMEKLNLIPPHIPTYFFHFPYSMNAQGQYITYQYVSDNIEKFNAAYDMLGDADSKELFVEYLNAQITGRVSKLESISKINPIFNELVSNNIDTFIDCGAFTGDTILEAYKYFGKLESIWGFEPDESNLHELENNISEIKDCKFYLESMGVWDESKKLKFSSNGSSSGIDSDGIYEIEVKAIDDVIDYRKLSNNVYLKMDIEGSEMKALQGAASLIKNSKPSLAICVYHRCEDLITIPQYIESICNDIYQYYLRYHGENFRELVLYAIPK